MKRFLLHVRLLIRYALGIEQEQAALMAAIATNIEHVNAAFRALTEQLNQTTAGAIDTDARLRFYEQHCETVRYAHERMKHQLALAQNGQIISIAGGVRGD